MSQFAHIPKPCSRDWDSLTGQGRVRYCDACGKDVHAIEPDRAEAYAGRCVRIEPVPPPRRSFLKSASLRLAGALGVALPIFGQGPTVRIRVRDILKIPCENATVSLTPEELSPEGLVSVDRRETRRVQTGTLGLATFSGLTPGVYRAQIAVQGYPSALDRFYLGPASRLDRTYELRVSPVMGEVVYIHTQPPAPEVTRLEVWVTNARGEPLPKARIEVQQANGRGAWTRVGSQLVLDPVETGEYLLNVSCKGYAHYANFLTAGRGPLSEVITLNRRRPSRANSPGG